MQSPISRTTTTPATERNYLIAIWCVIATGIALRLWHFCYNRSLWEDEIYLSAGIVKMTFHDLLTQQLPYLQKAPLGYLLMARAMVVAFGNTEMALRLYPLLTGIGSLLLFVPVVRHFLKPAGAVIAMAMLAFAPPLVYHSVEAKPYGTEMFATILALWWYIRYRHETDMKGLLLLGIYGAILVWFAYTAIFVLAAVALAISVPYLRHQTWKVIFRLMPVFALWVISFGVSYILFAKPGSDTGWLVDFWEKHEGYIPLKPASGAVWIVHRIFSFFHYPLGLSWRNNWEEHSAAGQIVQRAAWVPLVLIPAGITYFFNKQHRSFLLLTAATLLIALLASALKLYPFHERLTVYLAPLLCILIAGGCQWLADRNNALRLAGCGLAVLLMFGPVKNSIAQIRHPFLFGDYKKSYQREALQYVNDHYQAGDAVYIYRTDIPGYWYYKDRLSLKFKGVLGSDYRNTTNNFPDYFDKVDAEIRSLKAKRVWVIYHLLDAKVGDYTGVPAWYYVDRKAIERLHDNLMQLGKTVDAYHPADGSRNTNVSAYLIELP